MLFSYAINFLWKICKRMKGMPFLISITKIVRVLLTQPVFDLLLVYLPHLLYIACNTVIDNPLFRQMQNTVTVRGFKMFNINGNLAFVLVVSENSQVFSFSIPVLIFFFNGPYEFFRQNCELTFRPPPTLLCRSYVYI